MEIKTRLKLWWRIKPLSQSLKTCIERKLKHSLVSSKKRFPVITANRITLFRVIPAFAGLALYLKHGHPTDATLYLYAVAALMDFADGAWARANKETSSVGKIIDPIIDKLIVIPYLLTFAVFGAIYLWMTMLLIFLELLSTHLYVLSAARAHSAVGANWYGGTKKITQDALVLLVLMHPDGLSVAFNAILAFIGILAAMSCYTKFKDMAFRGNKKQHMLL